MKSISIFTLLIPYFITFATQKNLDIQNKISFWDSETNRGCNFFNQIPTEEWFKQASKTNIKWVRLAYDKWKPEKKDFLIGDASNYKSLIQSDLKKLKQVLSWAEKYKLKVVITPLSLPYCRWRQNNGDKQDSRLWESFSYQNTAIKFWKDLSQELKGYSCIVAYDILNEPYPEQGTNLQEQTTVGDYDRFQDWYKKYKETPRDLFSFYKKIITEIRKVDKETPIMVESGFYSQPPSYMTFPKRFDDEKILYSFHMYEPYAFTSFENIRRTNKYSYPSNIEFGDGVVIWNKDTINKYFEPFYRWSEANNIKANRIVASEFGCVRQNKGVEKYLEDVISVLENKKYHWAFYSYREDEWNGYDYELGTKPLPPSYWYAIEKGKKPKLDRKDNPLFNIIKKHLKK
jgi:hypothetical protein